MHKYPPAKWENRYNEVLNRGMLMFDIHYPGLISNATTFLLPLLKRFLLHLRDIALQVSGETRAAFQLKNLI